MHPSETYVISAIGVVVASIGIAAGLCLGNALAAAHAPAIGAGALLAVLGDADGVRRATEVLRAIVYGAKGM